MNVLARLRSVGVELCSDTSPIGCFLFGSSQPPVPPTLVTQANPLVSCLMMTRGHIELLRYSLACYQRQTYANRELVVVSEPETGEKVRGFLNRKTF